MASEARRIVRDENVRPYTSPQQKRQRIIAVVVVLIIAALGAGAYFVFMPKKEIYRLRTFQSERVRQADLVQTTQSSGTVEIPVQMVLPNPEAGYASKLYVSVGDDVVEGQLLAQVFVPDLDDQLDDLLIDLADSGRSLERFLTQNRFAVDQAERDIASLEQDLKKAGTERDRVAALVRVDGASQSELDKAEEDLSGVQKNIVEKKLLLQQDKTLQELDREVKEADIARLETKIRRLRERIAATSIRSPIDGEVLDFEPAMAVPGSRISANAELFTIADPSSAIVGLEVLEQYSALLTMDQQVDLTVGGLKLTGKITSIGRVAQMSSDGLGATVAVKVKPDVTSDSLLLGSTAVGVFTLGTKPNALLLPRGPYLTTGSQRYLYRVDGDTASRIDVTFGVVQGNEVEVLQGVAAGDEVITSGYQNFIEYDEIRLERGDRP